MPVQTIAAQELASILKLPVGTTVTMSGPPVGISTSYLASFDGSGDSPFFIMSTGNVTDVTLPNTSGRQGFDFEPKFFPDGDEARLVFTIPKPADAAALTFDFTFLSEEYPEYVGSAFNDFFSVKVNGVEVAVDLSNKPITVNNNFFTTEYSPTGTFFDAQTPPLKITVPIASSVTTVEVAFQISDVGDGIYDSAAFIKNLDFIEPQYVFVDFDAGHIEFETLLGLDVGFNLPGAGLSEERKQLIIDGLNEQYEDYLVVFSSQKPTDPTREYSTVHVGGKPSDLPDYSFVPTGLTGRAEHVDFGNKDKSDNAFVLSGSDELNGDILRTFVTIAHETGHLLGLRHVLDDTEMMFPVAGYQYEIGGEELLAELDDDGTVFEIGGTQDSRGELERNLGLRNNSKLMVRESTFGSATKYFNLSMDSSAKTIFGVKVVAVTADNEVLEIVDLGDIKGTSSQDLVLPALGSDKIVILGKSKANGGYDVFVTPDGTKKFNLAKAGEAGLLNKLAIAVSDLGTANLTISKAGSGGKLKTVGTMDAAVISVGASAGGPSDGPDTLSGDGKGNEVAGLDGDDVIDGKGGKDALYGNDGNDSLDGGKGSDTLEGGAGDDTLAGGKGGDLLVGGDGKADIVSYGNASSSVTVNLGNAEANTGEAKGDSYSGIENVFGSAFDDLLIGTDRPNHLHGGDGKDTIIGGGGRDTVSGGEKADSIDAGAGDDWVIGGAGKDTMRGGSGKDIFLFAIVPSKAEADTIVDFKPSDDTIRFDYEIFKELGLDLGVLNPNAFRANKTGRAEDADDRIIYDKQTGRVWLDPDGNLPGKAKLVVTIGENLPVTNEDFTISDL